MGVPDVRDEKDWRLVVAVGDAMGLESNNKNIWLLIHR